MLTIGKIGTIHLPPFPAPKYHTYIVPPHASLARRLLLHYILLHRSNHHGGTLRGRHRPDASLRDRVLVRIVRVRRIRSTSPPRGGRRVGLGGYQHRTHETSRPRHIHLPPRRHRRIVRATERPRQGDKIGADIIVRARGGELLVGHRVLGGNIEGPREGQESGMDECILGVLCDNACLLGLRGGEESPAGR